MNSDKTVYMIFRKKGAEIPADLPKIKLDGTYLQKVQTAPYLGLLLDEHLTWENHINLIKKKIAPAIGIFYRLAKVLNDVQKKSIYHALINSHLMYMNLFCPVLPCFVLFSCKLLFFSCVTKFNYVYLL